MALQTCSNVPPKSFVATAAVATFTKMTSVDPYPIKRVFQRQYALYFMRLDHGCQKIANGQQPPLSER